MKVDDSMGMWVEEEEEDEKEGNCFALVLRNSMILSPPSFFSTGKAEFGKVITVSLPFTQIL